MDTGKEFDYQAFLSGVPVAKGDLIDVSSDMLSILLFCRKRKLAFSPDRLLDALQELVGENGTVMIRAFTWDFCRGVPFNIRESCSRTGSLGNYAAKREDFSRTRHPIYSWWVWGKYRDDLCGIEEPSAFAEDGIFGFLYRNYGKQMGIGKISISALTILHYAEAAAKVPYRREKFFHGQYIDEEGNSRDYTCAMHVRPLNIDVTYEALEGEETQDCMRSLGIRTDQWYERELPCAVFDLRRAFDFIKTDLLDNDGKRILLVNQQPGISHPSIHWEQAEY